MRFVINERAFHRNSTCKRVESTCF